MKRKIFRIVSFYDTETCNIGTGIDTQAYVVLYIFNNIDCPIQFYEGGQNDNVSYYRYTDEAITHIENVINSFSESSIIPVICCYNLLFDLKSLMYELAQRYKLETLAKSTTQPYFVDLYKDDKHVLRFWDMFYLDMRGVAALGDACGLPKLTGSWDYSLIRTPETELTDEELKYAARDVQVLPKYLRWLLTNNVQIQDKNLANNCLTKTSIVRLDAKNTIGKLLKGKRPLLKQFNYECLNDAPLCYDQYKLRVESFRGGFTFTSGSYAMQLWENVTSLDVTSMHHAFINGSMIGRGYKFVDDRQAQRAIIDSVLLKTLSNVLKYYSQPFEYSFNACLLFKNLRLKPDTPFKKGCISCLAESRFKARNAITEEIRDECYNASFAFSKIIVGELVKVCITEYELYCISLMYDYDSYEVVQIESTRLFKEPPEYITLQSNKLFNQKNICKKALKHKLTSDDDISFMPEGFIEQIKTDTLNEDEFNNYYVSTIKGMFNGIYGTQAMNPIRDSFIIDSEGNISIDETKRPNAYNYEKLEKDWSKILYTYGARIVGRSRLHLIIAIILLDEYFGGRIRILAGDTDSLKIACDSDVTDAEIMAALQPLHDAITRAINLVQQNNRANYPDYASDLKNVGCFEIETPEKDRYKYHMEYWNKARISIDRQDNVHLTFAGLPSRGYSFGILNVLKKVYELYGVNACFNVLGYNVEISSKISNALEHRVPKADEKVEGFITDYRGMRTYVDAYQTIALYPSCRTIGSTLYKTNKENIEYLESIGIHINKYIKELDYVDGKIKYYCKGELMYEMEV